jgi:hypothetical protein
MNRPVLYPALAIIGLGLRRPYGNCRAEHTETDRSRASAANATAATAHDTGGGTPDRPHARPDGATLHLDDLTFSCDIGFIHTGGDARRCRRP